MGRAFLRNCSCDDETLVAKITTARYSLLWCNTRKYRETFGSLLYFVFLNFWARKMVRFVDIIIFLKYLPNFFLLELCRVLFCSAQDLVQQTISCPCNVLAIPCASIGPPILATCADAKFNAENGVYF